MVPWQPGDMEANIERTDEMDLTLRLQLTAGLERGFNFVEHHEVTIAG
jgi:hypothetical protein